jgi:hypothetical protein
MAKYRKRPVVIDAVPWEPGVEDTWGYLWASGLVSVQGAKEFTERRFQEDFVTGTDDCPPSNEARPAIVPLIKTLEGYHAISEGDWIITGVKGERYPIKGDIFNETYERVET